MIPKIIRKVDDLGRVQIPKIWRQETDLFKGREVELMRTNLNGKPAILIVASNQEDPNPKRR